MPQNEMIPFDVDKLPPEQRQHAASLAQLMKMTRKEDLDPELRGYLVTRGKFKMLKHPLVSAMLYAPELNADFNNKLRQKREAVADAKGQRAWRRYVFLHERPYRLFALSEIKDAMTDAEFWTVFGDVWSDSENLYQYGALLPKLLNCGRPERERLMEPKEREFLASLPQQVVVYRGHVGTNRNGWSWTLSYWKAQWFANRYGLKRHGVVRATVDKSTAIAAMTTRNSEFEIVLDPDGVKATAFNPKVWENPYLLGLALEGAANRTGTRLDSHHGVWHWNKVDWNVQQLCRKVPKADKDVCRAFAYLHDCRRVNENEDPDHGDAGAAYALALYQSQKLYLNGDQIIKLTDAIRDHEKGTTTDDPTIGVCWDADRLDIMRVGTEIDPKYLSTQAAKDLAWRV